MESTDPKNASEIGLEWLAKTLESKGVLTAHPVSCTIDDQFGSEGLLGSIARVTLEYEGKGQPESVIVKFQSSVSNKNREAAVYGFLGETGLDSFPELYAVFNEHDLVLEDLSPLSEKSSSAVDRAFAVVAGIAAIHGRFWLDPRIPQDPPGKFAGVIDYRMKESWTTFRDCFQDLLGEAGEAFEWVWENAGRVSAHRLSGPGTLFHGDLNGGNVISMKAKHRNPAFIDWQLAGKGLGANDISFYLLGQLSPSDRAEHEERLLKEYHRALPKAARSDYSFSRLFLDYRACSTRTMMSAVMSVGPLFASLPNREAVMNSLAERSVAAIRDLRPVEAFGELERLGV